ncbi:TPA: DUF551 domain-containing protein [Klebsiella pneumoniae]|nr:DUF551 domain-containing protein [Klebsiella pneumoniae]HBV3940491.1 DUF551 domain-containing protein [Klebsiella pneumoniae]HBV3963699.1 DUF551 domain-containing protein [Klebsiella pneumoniae]HBV3980838.1 DUF551 domain-containing protein [Klebsiella pneumoniae]HBV4038002.1 DUF551 domain-containing protein [Klebsiella pneumoniae]
MTSKLTRERLQEIAEDGFLKHGESKELARMALAEKASEPVILYRERNPYNGLTTGWQELTENEFSFLKENAGENAEFLTLYRHAQPVPVVPEEITSASAPEVFEIAAEAERLGLRGTYASYAVGWNACRAAMLQELKKSAGAGAVCRSNENMQVLHTNSPAIPDGYVMVPKEATLEMIKSGASAASNGMLIPGIYKAMLAAAECSISMISDTWIPVSERMPEVEGHYLVWASASRIDGYCDHLAIATYQGREWSNEFNWLVTHWMPLPAAPQEGK